MIEFGMDGRILTANANFLHVTGYALAEIQGQHHRLFVAEADQRSPEYGELWRKLSAGEKVSGQFRRIAKDGSDIWLEASYNPLLDGDGKPYKVIKYALDVTEERVASAIWASKLAAISRSTGVIEFALDGTILDANQTFLAVVGYSLDEVRGRHHSMFVEPGAAKTDEYRKFWQRLGRGEFISGKFRRIAKDGRVVWLEASYNPLFDAAGQPTSVIKFGTDITEQQAANVLNRGQIDAISASQAVIHLELDGKIRWANQIFLDCLGYSLAEIVGKPHRMFCENSYAASPDYAAFWKRLNAGQPISGECRRVAKNGEIRYLAATYTPILNDDGKPFMVVKFASDITDAKHKASQGSLVQSTFDRIIEAVSHVGERSESAVQASGNTASTVQAVAASTAELDSSIVDIAKSMLESRGAVQQAIDQASTADLSSQQLSKKITVMNEVVALIKNVTEQINLLALNASIEAARAGSAGRGFAVVATEVKSLANKVAVASQKIEQDIKEVQITSAEVVAALAAITSAIEGVQYAVVSTATAVEQQSSVTGTIASNMQDASASVGLVNERLSEIIRLVEAADSSARAGKETLKDALAVPS